MIKRVNDHSVRKYIVLQANPGVATKIGGQKSSCLEIKCNSMTILSKDAGDELVSEMKANQKAVIQIGKIIPFRYNVMVVVNPELNGKVSINSPILLEAGEEVQLDIYLQSWKSLDVSELPWTVRLYVIDREL